MADRFDIARYYTASSLLCKTTVKKPKWFYLLLFLSRFGSICTVYLILSVQTQSDLLISRLAPSLCIH